MSVGVGGDNDGDMVHYLLMSAKVTLSEDVDGSLDSDISCKLLVVVSCINLGSSASSYCCL
jgi:hypothetical protein